MTFIEWWDCDESRNGIYPSIFAEQAWNKQQEEIDKTLKLFHAAVDLIVALSGDDKENIERALVVANEST